MYKLKVKPFLEKDCKFVMGLGRYKLLKLVAETGSLSAAAQKMRMSYKHAWNIINKMNNAVGTKIVTAVRGGTRRGKTELTAEGYKLLREFKKGLKKLEPFL